MEAVPRLPMISFEPKTSTDNASFSQPLKQYIAQFYGEDPESYNNEIHKLESLRSGAVRPSTDVEGIQMLKKYYCQLHFLKSRFPMEELQAAAVYFSWKDTYSTLACSIPDIRFEMMCILYNIGCLHSQLGAMDPRVTPDGMKIACTHFQCAAWAFQVLRENYYQMVGYVSSIEVMNFMELVCLAQAQECILEKSMMDNRKATIIAKVAVQVVDYYKKAQTTLQGGVDENNYTEFVQVAIFKEWVKYLSFKNAYHQCIFLLYQGQQAEEQQKMGERVALYQAAAAKLEVARKISLTMDKKQEIAEAIAFTSDVVEGKKKAAKNENDFIYHEEIPNEETFPDIKGAALVKGIPFNVNDIEVSGPDIFARLVPMEAHEASSLYSERKAELLRKYGELIENKDQKLAEFMSSMQIDFLNDIRQATGLPQEIVDRAAALSAMPNAIQNLIVSMTKLSNSYHEVEALLNEIQELLKQEDLSEKEYQKIMGERPPSLIATDLSREAAKYREAHNKANDSNQNLHKAMMTHVANLKILSQPLAQLVQQIPFVEIPDQNIDEAAMKEVEMLLAKVEEMKNQRGVLWAQLRDALHRDDITGVLVTKRSDQSIEDVFKQELGKHQQLITYIEQNVAAQENIIKAFIDAYAKFSNTRRYLQGILSKRQTTINSLITSFDCYEDLLAKATKGVEFYNKLEGNITKLLQRIKSATKVQQEEREQMLAKKPAIYNKKSEISNVSETNTPKLKDVLESYKAANKASKLSTYPTNNFPPDGAGNQAWPPGVRPTPVGSEMTDVTSFKYDSTQNYGMKTYVDQNLEQRMASISVDDKNYQMNYNYMQNYANSGYVTQIAEGNYTAPVTGATGTTMVDYSVGGHVSDVKNPSSGASNTNLSNEVPITSYNQYIPLQQPIHPNQTNPSNFVYSRQNYQSHQIMNTIQSDGSVNYGNPTPQVKQMSNLYDFTGQNDVYMQSQYYNMPNYQNTSQNASGSYQNYVYQPSSEYGNFNQSNFVPTQTFTSSNYASGSLPISYDGNSVPGGYNSGNTVPTCYTSTGVAAGSLSTSHSGTSVSAGFNSGSSVPTCYSGTTVPTCYSGATVPTGYNTGSTVPTCYGGNITPTAYNNTVSSFANENSQNQANYGINNSFEMNTSTLPTSQVGYSAYGQTPFQGDPNYINYNQYVPSVPNPLNNTTEQRVIQTVTEKPKNPSTIDLLSGLEFKIDHVPLEPQQKQPEIKKADTKKEEFANLQQVKVDDNEIKVTKIDSTLAPVKSGIKFVPSKPLDNDDVKKLFRNEVEKYEKFVDVLSAKTLNGPTTIELKWKEIQDCQENDGGKKIISVARCYPMKNRFPDILPYDHSRVILHSTNDDYINASYIKDISQYAPLTIVTQAPMQSTMIEFWTMLLENQVEFVLCLLNDNEINGDIYWPTEKGKTLTVANMKITLESVVTEKFFVKRLITVNVPEKRESSSIIHLQFTDWPGSLFPSSPGPFVEYMKATLSLYQQQKPYKPIVIHCSSGIGRSGVACLLMFAILEATNNSTSLPDLTFLANRITSFRKNILRDREYLKFAYQAFLFYVRRILNDNNSLEKLMVNSEQDDKNLAENDPLNSLDPFWVVGKSNK